MEILLSNKTKYMDSISTFTLILLTRFLINIFRFDFDIQYITSITIAFIVSCYSSFIGHKKLFIGSFIIFSICFMISVCAQFEISLIILFFLNLSREILNIQIYIQICGQWPSQFVRVLVEIILLSMNVYNIILDMSIFIPLMGFKNKESFIFFCVTLFPFILLLIIKGVSSFKQPSTKSVHKDIIKAVFHYKPLIFTLLFASTLLLCILQLAYSTSIFKYVSSSEYGGLGVSLLMFLFSVLLLFISRKLKYQSTLIFAVVIIILQIFGIILLFKIDLFGYSLPLYIFVTINVIIYCLIHTVPQYQVILRSIDINNLDFASSYQSFAFAMICTSISYLLKDQLKILPQGINIWLPLLMCLVFVLGITFYGALGFRNYFYKSNQSQIQEQELEQSQI
ncbi:hypothetical protein pb186bvf_009198 [Paramecium bursaria]